jgi:hypothetical protein
LLFAKEAFPLAGSRRPFSWCTPIGRRCKSDYLQFRLGCKHWMRNFIGCCAAHSPPYMGAANSRLLSCTWLAVLLSWLERAKKYGVDELVSDGFLLRKYTARYCPL